MLTCTHVIRNAGDEGGGGSHEGDYIDGLTSRDQAESVRSDVEVPEASESGCAR